MDEPKMRPPTAIHVLVDPAAANVNQLKVFAVHPMRKVALDHLRTGQKALRGRPVEWKRGELKISRTQRLRDAAGKTTTECKIVLFHFLTRAYSDPYVQSSV